MIPFIITYMCLNVNPMYNGACSSALTAASMQYHLKQDFDIMQQNLEKEVTRKTGTLIWTVGLTAYQIQTKQQIAFNTPIKPVADNLSATVPLSMNSINLGLAWSF